MLCEPKQEVFGETLFMNQLFGCCPSSIFHSCLWPPFDWLFDHFYVNFQIFRFDSLGALLYQYYLDLKSMCFDIFFVIKSVLFIL